MKTHIIIAIAAIAFSLCACRKSDVETFSEAKATAKANPDPLGTNETELSLKIKARDGTNYLGTYMGMIAELDGQTKHYDAVKNVMYGNFPQGVMMFSATSGEMLKWIPYEDFKAIFVDRTRPEYPIP